MVYELLPSILDPAPLIPKVTTSPPCTTGLATSETPRAADESVETVEKGEVEESEVTKSEVTKDEVTKRDMLSSVEEDVPASPPPPDSG